ncbi:MAG: cytosine permease [Gammaproteobacteria bacterium]|nr:cytosine permease [Gammaproteobacteria bacterium]MDH4253223.1 cytosine permease [Gammaproteobacteria bacterium]MDH5308998.1 cytosine permease [Gammaproteobacteria bacterium]
MSFGAAGGRQAESEEFHGDLLSTYGREPMLPTEREYKFWGAHGTCFAYTIATWCFITGGAVANYVGAIQGMVCLIAGNLIGTLMVSASLSAGCHRYGLEQIDFCKPAFGQNGARIVLIFYLINMIGWSGLILVMFGNGIVNIADAMGYEPPRWLAGAGVALGIWITYLITTRGVHLLSLFNNIVTPGLLVVVSFMFYMLVTTYGWDEVVAAKPLEPLPTPWLNYAVAVELGIASGISWWGGVGFLARNTRSRRNAIYPEVIHFGLVQGIVCSIALVSGLMIGSDDPTRWMVPLGGLFMGVLALGFVALANITSTAVSLFASGLALRHVPGLHKRRWKQIIVLTCVPLVLFVIWPQELFDLGDTFLAYNGTMQAPVAGILLVDYFLLRKQHIHLRSIFEGSPRGQYYYSKGFNFLALAAVIAGQIAYFSVYDPFTDEAHDLFRYLPASVAAFCLPALVYWAGMKFGLERYYRSRLSDAELQPARLIKPNI